MAVTVGPGLEICLRVGCSTAKDLAARHAKPFVTVHHLEVGRPVRTQPAAPHTQADLPCLSEC